MSMLSNEKIINELNAIRNSFIKTRPEMHMNSFVSSRKQPYNLGDGSRHRLRTFLQGGGAPMNMRHPLAYGSINGNTLHPDPLYSGIVYRPVKGGAMLSENMPLEGGDYETESDSDYSESDSDEEGGDLMSESSEGEYSSDDEGEIGGGVYDSYIKPAGKALGSTLYNVGRVAFKDVVVPVGKELLKKAIMGALVGAGHHTVFGGRLTGTREEFIHILKKIDPSFKANRKHTKNDLRNEVYKHLGSAMSPKDLQTLHYLDALASYNVEPDSKYGAIKTEGGLNGKKRELQELLKAMYPDLDFKRMSKEQIIKHITGHINESKLSEQKQKHEEYEKKHTIHKIAEIPEEIEPPPPHIEEEVIVKVKKPRGRPKVEKPVKEKKPRGRPRVEKPVKEKKPRGRPKVEKPVKVKKEKVKKEKVKKEKVKKEKASEKPLEALEEMFKEIEEPKPKPAKSKIKKLIGTKRGNRARGDIVAEVMKKQGLTLPQASKYVSEHNLY